MLCWVRIRLRRLAHYPKASSGGRELTDGLDKWLLQRLRMIDRGYQRFESLQVKQAREVSSRNK